MPRSITVKDWILQKQTMSIAHRWGGRKPCKYWHGSNQNCVPKRLNLVGNFTTLITLYVSFWLPIVLQFPYILHSQNPEVDEDVTFNKTQQPAHTKPKPKWLPALLPKIGIITLVESKVYEFLIPRRLVDDADSDSIFWSHRTVGPLDRQRECVSPEGMKESIH